MCSAGSIAAGSSEMPIRDSDDYPTAPVKTLAAFLFWFHEGSRLNQLAIV
jgi:hypothetical protein